MFSMSMRALMVVRRSLLMTSRIKRKLLVWFLNSFFLRRRTAKMQSSRLAGRP